MRIEYYWRLTFNDGTRMTLIAMDIPHILKQLKERLDQYNRNHLGEGREKIAPPALIGVERGRQYAATLEDAKELAIEAIVNNMARAMRIPVEKARKLIMATLEEGKE